MELRSMNDWRERTPSQQNNGKKDCVTRSFLYSTLAIFGLLQFVLITGSCAAAYYFLIIPRIGEVNQFSVQGKAVMEDPVAGIIKKLRLADGSGSNEGRVEVFVFGQWGTVCDYEFDHKDAKVICRMLGYRNGV